ncbi:GatB/YqeY domain-containing protein [Niveibacterium terrae]|uniref:GatB/YqeY domain-containing protein n=1 Tax=Niveibacterium terrae TaxID=3373598 RepID=UPI003A8F5033
MSLKDQITEDMKAAMRAKDSARLGALRLLLAAIKQIEVDQRIVLDDAAIQAVIEKQVKQRRDSVSQYASAGREDLASAERFEIEVLSAYMPEQMSAEEIDAAIDDACAETGASGPAAMGKLMGLLKGRLAGKADMAQVSARLKTKLAS